MRMITRDFAETMKKFAIAASLSRKLQGFPCHAARRRKVGRRHYAGGPMRGKASRDFPFKQSLNPVAQPLDEVGGESGPLHFLLGGGDVVGNPVMLDSTPVFQ